MATNIRETLNVVDSYCFYCHFMVDIAYSHVPSKRCQPVGDGPYSSDYLYLLLLSNTFTNQIRYQVGRWETESKKHYGGCSIISYDLNSEK